MFFSCFFEFLGDKILEINRRGANGMKSNQKILLEELIEKKKIAWEYLKQKDFQFPFSEKVLALIEENLHRVQFVNDHIGVRDFLFISEDDTFYTSNFFVAIDVECEKEYSYQKNLELMLRKYIDYPVEAYQKLVHFFTNTNRTLYVGVGFVESIFINMDKYEEKLEEGLSEEEALKQLRNFPDWYKAVALDPDNISYLSAKAEKYINNLKRIEQIFWNEKMNIILMKKDLDEADHRELRKLSCLLKA